MRAILSILIALILFGLIGTGIYLTLATESPDIENLAPIKTLLNSKNKDLNPTYPLIPKQKKLSINIRPRFAKQTGQTSAKSKISTKKINQNKHPFTITFIDSYTGRIVKNKLGTITFSSVYSEEETDTTFKDLMINDEGEIKVMLASDEYSVISKFEGFASSSEYSYFSRSNSKKFIRLYKSGSLDIILLNEKGERLKNATIKISNPRKSLDLIEEELDADFKYQYNKKLKTHHISQIAVGWKNIVVHAAGYQKSQTYRPYIYPNKSDTIKVILKKSKRIRFKLIANTTYLSKEITLESTFKSIHYGIIEIAYEGQTKQRTVIPDISHIYQYNQTSEDLRTLTILIDGFEPVAISLTEANAIAKIKLKPTTCIDILVLDEEKKPLKEARVQYNLCDHTTISITNQFGQAKIYTTNEKSRNNDVLTLDISASHFHTMQKRIELAPNLNTITISMVKDKFQKGIVQFNNTPISNANVILITDKRTFILDETDKKGVFTMPFSKEKKYKLSAFHKDYGISVPQEYTITKEGTAQINLKKADDFQIKYIFPNKKPFSFQAIFIFSKNHHHYELFKTNEQGIIFLKNRLPGIYSSRLDQSSSFKLKNEKFELPKSHKTIITIQKKGSIKLLIKSQTGQILTDNIRVYLKSESYGHYANSEPNKTMPITISENKYICFQVEPYNYKDYIIEINQTHTKNIGSLEKEWDGPKEIVIDLRLGKFYNITLIDRYTQRPISQAYFSIYSENKSLGAKSKLHLKTNESGQVTQKIDATQFTLDLTVAGYIPVQKKYDQNSDRNILIELDRGGNISGVIGLQVLSQLLKKSNSTKKPIVYLRSQMRTKDYQSEINKENGLFSFKSIPQGLYVAHILSENIYGDNLIPGEVFSRNNTLVKQINSSLGTYIYVENEKTIQLNFSRDGETTLDLQILNCHQENIKAKLHKGFQSHPTNLIIKNGFAHIPKIHPGNYKIEFIYQENKITKVFFVKHNTQNQVNISLETTPIVINIKDENGNSLPTGYVQIFSSKKLTSLNIAENYFTKNSVVSTNLPSNHFYHFRIDMNHLDHQNFTLRTSVNYQKFISKSFFLSGQATKIFNITIQTGRILPNFQVVGKENKSLRGIRAKTSKDKRLFLTEGYFNQFLITNDKGFLPKKGWPKKDFYLRVHGTGYATKTILISKNLNTSQILKIQLEKEATITCQIPQTLMFPISIGLLNKSGQLTGQTSVHRKVFLMNRNLYTKAFLNYYSSKSNGNLEFTQLNSGTYYIGYFWNGTKKLISKQGPFHITPAQNLKIISNVILPD